MSFKSRVDRLLCTAGAIGLGAMMVSAPGINAPAIAAGSVKMGIVAFLSGGAAGPFGVPARNSAELMIGAINAGKVPGAYSSVGRAVEPSSSMAARKLISPTGFANPQGNR